VSYKEHTMYSVECDHCGKNAQEDGDYSCWSDRDFALDDAKENEFNEVGDKIYCQDCWTFDEDGEEVIAKHPPKEKQDD